MAKNAPTASQLASSNLGLSYVFGTPCVSGTELSIAGTTQATTVLHPHKFYLLQADGADVHCNLHTPGAIGTVTFLSWNAVDQVIRTNNDYYALTASGVTGDVATLYINELHVFDSDY